MPHQGVGSRPTPTLPGLGLTGSEMLVQSGTRPLKGPCRISPERQSPFALVVVDGRREPPGLGQERLADLRLQDLG
jgi:hypothetical protein